MTFATIPHALCAAIKAARDDTSFPKEQRRELKAYVFGQARTQYGIPDTTKLKVDTDPTSGQYGVLKDSATGQPFTLNATGKWNGAASVPAPAPAMRWYAFSKDELTEFARDREEGDSADSFVDCTHEAPPDESLQAGNGLAIGLATVWVQVTAADLGLY